MDAFGILPNFTRTAVHDGWASYQDFPCQHALCNAHHLRELIPVGETTCPPWAQAMINFLCRAKDIADQAQAGPTALTSDVGSALRPE